MSLLTVDGYLREIEYDFSRVINAENQAFLHGLLRSIDPFTNPGIHEVVMKNGNDFAAKEYFELPIKCLLRIEKSIQLWTREWGRNGYFEFIERQMGHLVEPDEKMNFSVLLKEENAKRLGIAAIE